MLKFFFSIFLLNFIIQAQINSFHSFENIKLFADYLFCQKDYLRAIEEYNRLSSDFVSDTTLFKIGYSYFHIDNLKSSEYYLKQIPDNSKLKNISLQYLSLNYFLRNDFTAIKNIINNNAKYDLKNSLKLLLFSNIINNRTYPSKEELLIYDEDEISFIDELIYNKNNPHYKSPTFASILSIIPGLGKIYTKNYTDGLTSFILTTLFSFLAFDNFSSKSEFKGYLFALIGFGFYAGNIFGSALSAIKYNKHFDEKIQREASNFLIRKNYFISDVEVCK